MTLGSLFNGISGWILAGEKYGVKTLWESEIDDYCQAVTHYHFPEVKQLGDITKINVDKLEPVDIICAGSPCQDLSVAGKKRGLAGERSGLFRTAIDIVHRLRNRTGMPRYFVWENVPGAFSSNKGLDFRAVLEEISQTEIPMPKDNKWAEAGVVEGSQFIIFDLTEIAKKQGMLWTILSFFVPNVMHTLILRQGNTVALSIGTKGYTDIEYKGKPAPDSKRYKALGNGMAQVCADFVIRRIVEVNK